MSTLPNGCGIGPGGQVVFGERGVLSPGWKAAIAMLELEAKIAANEVAELCHEGDVPTEESSALLSRIHGCEVAVSLLQVHGLGLGLDV